MEGNCKRARFLEKSWQELARKLSYLKKPDTNWQGSWLFPENLARLESGAVTVDAVAGLCQSICSEVVHVDKNGGLECL
jgi:hypothetical protein